MPNDVSGWKRSAAQMAIVNTGLQLFCESIVRHGVKGNKFDGDAIGQVIGDTLRAIKNMDVTGITFEDETDLLRDSIQQLETTLSIAVAKGFNV